MAISLSSVKDYVGELVDSLQPSPTIPSGRATAMPMLLTNLTTLETIEYLTVADVGNAVDANWNDVAIRGRSEPLVFYSETGPDTWSFNMTLSASINERDGGNAEKCMRDWLFIKASAYPDYEGDESMVPPTLFNLRWGRAFDEIGIIKAPNAQFKAPYVDELPTIIEVTFTFQRVSVPRSSSEVRNQIR